MANQLVDILEVLAKENPELLKQLIEQKKAGLGQDKLSLYDWLVKSNPKFDYKLVNELLERHELNRLDINWNKEGYIYRIVFSKRKLEEVKKDGRSKPNSNNGERSTNGTTNGTTEQATSN